MSKEKHSPPKFTYVASRSKCASDRDKQRKAVEFKDAIVILPLDRGEYRKGFWNEAIWDLVSQASVFWAPKIITYYPESIE